jgi:hypothetical protein
MYNIENSWNEKNYYFCTEDSVKNNYVKSQKLFCKKKSFRKDFRTIFLEEKIGFKRNHIKRQG